MDEKKIMSYVERCFKDAFLAEERPYDPNQWSFEYIIIKNDDDAYQLVPVNLWCKHERVRRRVAYRLENNLYKNFGIIYYDSEDFHVEFYKHPNTIDPTRCKALIKTKKGLISVVIHNKENHTLPKGEVIPNGIYEKLVLTYWNIDIDTYAALDEDDKRKHLPSYRITKNDWFAYTLLWEQAFGEPIKQYEIICSSGIKVVKTE